MVLGMVFGDGQSKGGFGDGPLNAVNRIFSRSTSVAMATKFGTKWAITRPLKRKLHAVWTYPHIFGPELSDVVIYISLLATPVAMATNFGTKFTIARSV